MICCDNIESKGFHDWVLKELNKNPKIAALKLLGAFSNKQIYTRVSDSSRPFTLLIIKNHFPEIYNSIDKLMSLK
jgi:hypothetical protein